MTDYRKIAELATSLREAGPGRVTIRHVDGAYYQYGEDRQWRVISGSKFTALARVLLERLGVDNYVPAPPSHYLEHAIRALSRDDWRSEMKLSSIAEVNMLMGQLTNLRRLPLGTQFVSVGDSQIKVSSDEVVRLTRAEDDRLTARLAELGVTVGPEDLRPPPPVPARPNTTISEGQTHVSRADGADRLRPERARDLLDPLER